MKRLFIALAMVLGMAETAAEFEIQELFDDIGAAQLDDLEGNEGAAPAAPEATEEAETSDEE